MALLVHGTALAIGNTGLILLGPSGSGKSTLALQLISGAVRAGHFATLLSDDQVWIEPLNGRLVATAPATIKGMIELRGSGIGNLPTIDRLVLHYALSIVVTDNSTRIPEENQFWRPAAGFEIPQHFINRAVPEPFALVSALITGFPIRT